MLEVSSTLNTNVSWLPLIYSSIFRAKLTQSISSQPFYLVVSVKERNTQEVSHPTPRVQCQLMAGYLSREGNIY